MPNYEEDLQKKIKGYAQEGGVRPADLLERLQEEYGHIPEGALEAISGITRLPLTQINAVATFYSSFSMKPRGKNVLQVCQGTACHVKGGRRLKERLEDTLGIKTGETTKDKEITLLEVRCLGCCNRAPVVVTNGEIRGRVGLGEVTNLIQAMKQEKSPGRGS